MRADAERSHRGYYVLIVAMLLSLPLESILPRGSLLLRAFWLGLPFVAAVSLARRGWRLVIGVVMALGAGGISLTGEETWGSFAMAIAFVYTTAVLLFDVFSHRRVTGATVSGALCAFILLGVVFALIYRGIVVFEPASFHGPGPEAPTGGDMAYFSFVTLTTLGYGDISPATETVKNLAVFEALVGQLYMVAVVARLVGLSAAPPTSEAGAS